MATEKQIAANRRNARRSTGPAHRGWQIDCQPQCVASRLVLAARDRRGDPGQARPAGPGLAAESPDANTSAATEAAAAQLDLLRIQKVRSRLLAEIALNNMNPQKLQSLLAIDRYEQRARTRPRRAGAKIGPG